MTLPDLTPATVNAAMQALTNVHDAAYKGAVQSLISGDDARIRREHAALFTTAQRQALSSAIAAAVVEALPAIVAAAKLTEAG